MRCAEWTAAVAPEAAEALRDTFLLPLRILAVHAVSAAQHDGLNQHAYGAVLSAVAALQISSRHQLPWTLQQPFHNLCTHLWPTLYRSVLIMM